MTCMPGARCCSVCLEHHAHRWAQRCVAKLQDYARGYAGMTYHTIMQLQYVTVMYDNVCSLYFSINS